MVATLNKGQRVFNFAADIYNGKPVAKKLSQYGLAYRKGKTEKDMLMIYKKLFNNPNINSNMIIDMFAEQLNKYILKDI